MCSASRLLGLDAMSMFSGLGQDLSDAPTSPIGLSSQISTDGPRLRPRPSIIGKAEPSKKRQRRATICRDRDKAQDGSAVARAPKTSTTFADVNAYPLETHPVDVKLVEVIEIQTEEEKAAAIGLHLSKKTFQSEAEWIHRRIHDSKALLCRTWLLVEALPAPLKTRMKSRTSTSSLKSVARRRALAAVTARINFYQNRCGGWGQILSVSTACERQGLGTMLVAGHELLMRREGVDVLTLYPAQNCSARPFWASFGYEDAAESSKLPVEERVGFDVGGPLVREQDPRTERELPRWEKCIIPGARIVPTSIAHRVATSSRKGAYRRVPPSRSRVFGEEFEQAVNRASEQRRSR